MGNSHNIRLSFTFNGHCPPYQHCFLIEKDTQMPLVWKDSQLFSSTRALLEMQTLRCYFMELTTQTLLLLTKDLFECKIYSFTK